jgi:hypothetical protein
MTGAVTPHTTGPLEGVVVAQEQLEPPTLALGSVEMVGMVLPRPLQDQA